MSPEEEKEAEAALKMFNELVTSGCSLRDIVVTLYFQGKAVATGKPPVPAPRKAASVPICPYDVIVDRYNARLCNRDEQFRLKRCTTIDNPRRAVIRSFWCWLFQSVKIASDGTRSTRAKTKDEAMRWIDRYFDLVYEDDFTMGRGGRSKGHENWDPGIEYVLHTKCVKGIIEKNRDRQQAASGG